MIIIFFLVWIIFNGKITLEITLFGVAISILIYLFSYKFLDYSLGKEIKFYKTLGLTVSYMGILIVEIIKANFMTMRFILSGREDIDPIIIEFDCDLKSNVARTLLADSITLTPGTITVNMEENHYVVHCLDTNFAADIETSIFVDKIKKLDELWGQK